MSEEIESKSDSESLRVKEAAAILKVHPRTIWRMIADGQLTACRFRRCTRLLRAQVLNYLKGDGEVGSA
jgi:excisionase family DNA binding protein